ncbi:sporulation histidine kinase inhibitor Sda [Lentibacillus kapialis]|nr:sporulation histidine kinase inhibitor Sda [Lentibacillus kapialis]
MRQLSDELLVDLYHRAIKHKLENEFIQLIKKELKKRSIIIEGRTYD